MTKHKVSELVSQSDTNLEMELRHHSIVDDDKITIIFSNKVFDLTQVFTKSFNRSIFGKELKQRSGTNFYCWSILIGFLTIQVQEGETFLDGIYKFKKVVENYLIPTHFISASYTQFLDSENPLVWDGEQDGKESYVVFTLSPLQRRRIGNEVSKMIKNH